MLFRFHSQSEAQHSTAEQSIWHHALKRVSSMLQIAAGKHTAVQNVRRTCAGPACQHGLQIYVTVLFVCIVAHSGKCAAQSCKQSFHVNKSIPVRQVPLLFF